MIRAFFLTILMVVLIAFSGYNTWQIGLLQAEVGSLRTELHQHAAPGRHTADLHPDASDALDPTDLVERARVHADRARIAVENKNFGTAQAEWHAATIDLNRASTTSTSAAQGQLDAIRNQLARIENASTSYFKGK